MVQGKLAETAVAAVDGEAIAFADVVVVVVTV